MCDTTAMRVAALSDLHIGLDPQTDAFGHAPGPFRGFLDMLLREAGDKGLHYDIKKLRPPAIVEHDTPAHSLYAKHQTAAEKRWNAKSAARAAARKTAA